MSSINPQQTYLLNDAYESIKENALQILNKYIEYPDLISFNDMEKSITFFSEKLIPSSSKNRPRVMLLFSNPHPHSIHQGMFLSPNTKGRENLFWPVMEHAGWLPITKERRNPEQLRDICLNADYEGFFELIFYAYYSFPTDYPEDIKSIFGKDFFKQVIEPEAINEFKKIIQETSVEAIVTFNKGIFNLVAKDPMTRRDHSHLPDLPYRLAL